MPDRSTDLGRLDPATVLQYRAHAAARSTVKGAVVGNALQTQVPLGSGGVLETLFDRDTGLPLAERVFAAGQLRVERTM